MGNTILVCSQPDRVAFVEAWMSANPSSQYIVVGCEEVIRAPSVASLGPERLIGANPPFTVRKPSAGVRESLKRFPLIERMGRTAFRIWRRSGAGSTARKDTSRMAELADTLTSLALNGEADDVIVFDLFDLAAVISVFESETRIRVV